MISFHRLLWCVLIASTPACSGGVTPGADIQLTKEDQPSDDEEPQGRSLTGDRLGFQTAILDTFTDATGAPLYNIHVERAELVGMRANLSTVRGYDFNGVTFRGKTDAGETLFTIVAVMPEPDDLVSKNGINPEDPALGPSTWLYQIVAQVYPTTIGAPLPPPTAMCAGDKTDGFAVPFAGGWGPRGERQLDYSRLTLSCMRGVIAKCGARWGYKPWVTPKHTDLSEAIDTHQSCVRAARADYCGQSESHTVDATPIHLTDYLVPEIRRENGRVVPGRSFEAAWDNSGARCVTHVRWESMPDDTCQDRTRVPPYMTEQPDKTWTVNYCESVKEARALATQKGWTLRVFIDSHLHGSSASN